LVGRGRNFREKEAVTERQAKPRSLVHFKKTDQAHFSLGVRAYGYGHKDRAAVKLLSLILGGSMSSRLFISLRERLGLAYYVRTETETYTDTGYVTTRAGVPVDKLDQAVGVVLKEYQAVKEKAVGAAELKRTKEMLNGRSAIQFEASDNLANYYGRQIAMTEAVRRATGRKISLDTPEKYLSEIKAVTSADLRRVAREIFTDNKLNLAVIGPYHDGKSFEKILSI
jgi:predicted Zn-dependent peptidase